MSDSRIRPSPARSLGQGVPASPRRVSSRKTRSVSSPARSTASGRLSSVIRLQDMDSFRLSPMPTRRSVLNDDTDVAEESRRRSWWKKLSNNSRDVMMEVLNDNKVLETNEAIEEYIDVEVLSQEKKNYTMDIPESSDSESISSIVIPQRKLFTEKENKPQKKFSQLGTRRFSDKLHKTTDNDKTVTVAPKNLFNHPSRAKSKPVFPAELLTISPEKIVNKTKEITAGEVKVQARPLFGNRASNKRKSMFIDFIVSESEDEISEIQPRVFGFQKKGEQLPVSANAQRRDPSPTSSITTDVEMDEWKHLPSSTMVENQLEDMMADKTPVKKAKLSKLSTNNTSINKTKQSVKEKSLNSSKVLARNQSQNPEVQQKQTKSYGQNSLTEDASINVNIENQKQVVEEIQDKFDKDVEMDNDDNAITENYLNTDTEKNNIIADNQSLTMQNQNSSISSTKPNNKSINSKNQTENYDPVKTNASLNKLKPSRDIEPNTSQTKNDTNANINVTKNVDKSKTTNESANSINGRVINESETKGQNQEESEVEEEYDIELSLHYESEEDNENQDNETLAKSVLNDEETSVEKENDSQDEMHNNSEEVNHDNRTQEEIQDESYIRISETQNEKEGQINAVVKESDNDNQDSKVPNVCQEKIEKELSEQSIKNILNAGVVEELEEPDEPSQEEHEKSQVQEQSQEEQEQTEDDQEHSVQAQEQSEEEQEETEEEQEQSVEAQEQSEEEQEQTEEEQEQSVEAQEQSEEEQEQTEEEHEHSVEAQEQSEEEQEQTEEEQEQSVEAQEQTGEKQEHTEKEQEQSVEAQEQTEEEQEQTEEQEQSVEAQEQTGEKQEHTEKEQEQSVEAQEQTEEEHEHSVEAQEQSEEEQEQTEEEQEQSVEAQEQTGEKQEHTEKEQEQSVEAQEQTEEEQEQTEEQEQSVEAQEQSDEEQEQSAEEQEQSDEEQVQSEEEQEQSVEEQEEHKLEESQEVEPLESSAEIEDSNENNAQNDEDVDMENDEESELENSETPNVSHDTTGQHRKKEHSKVKSPEAVLHDKTKQIESFMAKGRNTSLRRTSIMKSMNIRTSLAPPRESTGLSDGTRNSSAEGSGWDSHRTTRKTLRQTFGKDFSPRKSLRALVMEKSAKRQTAINDITSVTSKFPQANSTELPEASNLDENDYPGEANHDVSKRTRQTTLEMYLQKIKKQNMEKKMKMEEAVRNSLKAPPKDITNIFKVPARPPFAARKSSTKQAQNKPKARQIKSNLLCFDDLPDEVKEDMKYKPPKRFQPNDAAWITKRLYKSLETKLESKYDYKARVRAEKLVQSIYQFCRELKRREVAPPDAVETLKHEMARLDIVKTHFEFYQFFREYMPREIRIKVIPDIVNKIPMPRQGIFSDILRGNTIHE